MSAATPSNQNRSVSIGGSVTNGMITTGDSNTTSLQIQQATLVKPETVNIQAELKDLYRVLLELQSPDSRKIERTFEDIKEELQKPDPNKDEIGHALDRAINYAKKANGFAEAIDKLRPHVEKSVAWLGENWHKLLLLVGLAI
jgi:hypothetical protein